MKNKYKILPLLLAIIPLFSSCDEYKEERTPINSPAVLSLTSAQTSSVLEIVTPQTKEIKVYVQADAIADQTLSVSLRASSALVETYNSRYGTDYRMLPSTSYTFPEDKLMLPRYNKQSTTFKFTIDSKAVEDEGTYILPIEIAEVTGTDKEVRIAPSSELYFLVNIARLKAFEGGKGTKNDPYIISDARQMNNMHSVVEDGKTVYFELAGDVDMTGVDWEPLNWAAPYTKAVVLDGRGHTISNFSCNYDGYPSFFGVLNGECRNVRFLNAKVTIVGGYCGGIITAYQGTTGIHGLIEQCAVQGEINSVGGKAPVGGISGIMVESEIRNCYSDVKVVSNVKSPNNGVGGMVGQVRAACTIENCYSLGTVLADGDDNSGGLVGSCKRAVSDVLIKNCFGWNTQVNSTSNVAVGRVIGDFKFANGSLVGLYGRKDMVLMSSGAVRTSLYQKADGSEATVDGDDCTDIIATAKTLWPSEIWDFTGTYPELKVLKK